MTATRTTETTGGLTQSDLSRFESLGIGPDLLAAAQVRRVSDREARRDFGITGSPSMDMAGIIFPYVHPVTDYRATARLRRDNPEIENGKEKNKYISASRDTRHLYFPPGSQAKLADAQIPFALVESEKGALALAAFSERRSMSLLPVGMGGCWGWRGATGKTENTRGKRVVETGPLYELNYFANRKGFVMLDSNVATNPKVSAAEASLVAELRKLKCEVRLCRLPHVDGLNGPDDYVGTCGDDAMAAVLASARTVGADDGSEEWEEVQSLGGELPPVEPFDPELLPESLRPMVEDVADRMQVPLDFPAVVVMAILAGLCGRRAIIQPKKNDHSWTVTPNLWGGIIAPPGMMKSPVISSLTAPARAIESELRQQHHDALCEFEESKERAELEKQAWKEDYKRKAKRGAPRPSMPESHLTRPTERRLLTTDATYEGLQLMLAENPAGIFVLRDELSGWLASLERPGRETERSFSLECWSGDSSFTIDRIGRGSVHAEHCCVSLFGGIQPAKLCAYLADALRDGPTNDGLIQRFQLLVWPDVKRDWIYQDRPPNAEAIKIAEEVYRRIVSIDVENPLRLTFSPDAQALFVAYLTALQTRISSDEESSFMQAHLAKYRKLMPALALLIALADGCLDAVGLDHAEKAADWCEYLELHARRVYASRINPERLAAISLGHKLRKGWKRNERCFSVRQVYLNDWTGLSTPDEVRAALRILEDAGWVRRRTATSSTGRPSEIYDISPRIGEHNGDH
jgi:hypothetical protein